MIRFSPSIHPALLTAAVLLSFSSVALGQNRLLQFSGNFQSTFTSSSGSYQGVTNFDATWSFIFDESQVNLTQSGFQTFDITTVTFNATTQTEFGLTFTMPEAIARVVYEEAGGNYELNDVSLNGTPAGAQFVDGASDDFAFSYNDLSDFGSVVEGYSGTGDTALMLISRAGASGTQSGAIKTGSFTVSAVPEPSTAAALLGVIALGATAGRRRRT